MTQNDLYPNYRISVFVWSIFSSSCSAFWISSWNFGVSSTFSSLISSISIDFSWTLYVTCPPLRGTPSTRIRCNRRPKISINLIKDFHTNFIPIWEILIFWIRIRIVVILKLKNSWKWLNFADLILLRRRSIFRTGVVTLKFVQFLKLRNFQPHFGSGNFGMEGQY